MNEMNTIQLTDDELDMLLAMIKVVNAEGMFDDMGYVKDYNSIVRKLNKTNLKGQA